MMHAGQMLRRCLVLLAIPAFAVTGHVEFASGEPLGIDSLPLVDRLDAGVESYSYRMGWNRREGVIAGTPAGKVNADPEVQRFFEEYQRVLDRKLALDPLSVLNLAWEGLNHDLVVARRPADRDPDEQAGTGQGEVMPQFWRVLVIEPAGDTGERRFEAALERLHHAGEKDEGGAEAAGTASPEAEPFEVNGVTFESLSPLHPRKLLARQGGHYVVVDSADAAKWYTGKPKETLAEASHFARTVGPLLEGMDGELTSLYYYNTKAKWDRLAVGPAAPMWDLLSWRSLDGVAGATIVQDGHYRNRHYWRVGEKRVGLFKHSQTARVNQDWLARIPDDASGFTTGVWDPGSFLRSLVGLYAAPAIRLSGTEDPAMWQQMMTPMQMVSVIDSVLTTLGPRYMFYRLPGRYGNAGIPMVPSASIFMGDKIVVMESPNPHACFEAIETLMMKDSPMMRASRIELLGHDTLLLQLAYDTIYLAQLDKAVMLAFSPQMLKDGLAFWDNPDPKHALVNTKPYPQVARNALPDACFQMYIAPGGFSRGIFDKYLPVLQQFITLMQGMYSQDPDPDLPKNNAFRLWHLPRGTHFARHVGDQPTFMSARDDGQGVLFDAHAPVLCSPFYWITLRSMREFLPAETSEWMGIMTAVVVEPPKP